MERWIPLTQHVGYSISDRGRVRNETTGRVLAISTTNGGNTAIVSINMGGYQIKRGLGLLVCEAFLTPPRSDFNTPIYLDGDTMNCHVNNLTWRPRWFAQKHTTQFRQNLGDAGPVRDINTGVVYPSVWDVVIEHGVLFNEVIISAANKTYVFPLMHYFEWLESD